MNLDDALARVAAHGLAGSPALATIEGIADWRADEWLALGDAVAHERLTGLLRAALDDGAIAVPEAARAALDERHRTALAACIQLEALLSGVADIFSSAGIELRVLKGAALAHTLYPPSWRTYGDIDLLVRGHQWEAACERLREAGCTARFAEPRPGFTARFGKGVCHVAPSGLEIDLHRTLTAGAFGLTIDADRLFDGAQPFRVGSTELLALAPTDQLLHAAVHAVLGARRPRLSALRDVASLLSAPEIDHDALRERAADWRLGAVLARAITVAGTTLAVDLPLTAWARAHVASRFERRALDAYVSERRSYAAQAAAGVAALRHPRDKVAYSWAMVHPDRAYLNGRDARYSRRLLRAVRVLGGGGR